MFYKKSYSTGGLGQKGNPSIVNKIFGGVKNAGLDFAQGYFTNKVIPHIEKKVVNYLEKAIHH
jgi:hypothetical protein